MSKPRFFIFTCLILILQLTFFRKIKIYDAQPDLLLITVIYFGLFQNFRLGFLVGLWCGFLEDIFSLAPLGVHTFSFALLGLIMGFLSSKLDKPSLPLQVLLTVVSSLALGLIFNALTKISLEPNFTLAWISMILPGSLYTGLVAPLIIFILRNLFKPLRV